MLAKLAYASFLTMLVLIGCFGTASKFEVPYVWNNQLESPMFVNREWYRHPVYGPIYIDRDQLRFSESICGEIGQGEATELLSLPFSYRVLFLQCSALAWIRADVLLTYPRGRQSLKLIGELQTAAPPQWIVYQRQLQSLKVHEQIFNHGQPLALARSGCIDHAKGSVGEWQLVDMKKSQYGDGWYVVRTRP